MLALIIGNPNDEDLLNGSLAEAKRAMSLDCVIVSSESHSGASWALANGVNVIVWPDIKTVLNMMVNWRGRVGVLAYAGGKAVDMAKDAGIRVYEIG